MSTVFDQLTDLLEDFRAVGDEFWEQCSGEADVRIEAGVRGGQLGDFRQLAQTRDAMTRLLAVQKISVFMLEQGLQEQAESVMLNTFTQREIDNLQEGAAPSQDTIEAFRLRCLLVHFASVEDAREELSPLIDGN